MPRNSVSVRRQPLELPATSSLATSEQSPLGDNAMKKFAVIVGIVLTLGIAGLQLLSRKAGGYARATAEAAAERVEDAIPAEIHDKKLDTEVRSVRQEIIDRQVAMNLSARQIEQLSAEVSSLEGTVASRKRLLVDAYPVLKAAIDGHQQNVAFANQEYPLAEFQREVDDLLAMQDRETRQVEIKTAGLARLKKSVEEGHAALAEMKHALEATEQEVALLRSRRDQANVESMTLDLVSSATAKSDSVGSVMTESVARLKGSVDQVESRNEARRGMSGPEKRSSSRGIDRHWNRLESLKAIHDDAGGAEKTVAGSGTEKATQREPQKTEASAPAKIDAAKVTITVEGTPTAQ